MVCLSCNCNSFLLLGLNGDVTFEYYYMKKVHRAIVRQIWVDGVGGLIASGWYQILGSR